MSAIRSWSVVTVITLALLEVSLRVFFPAQLADVRANVLRSEETFLRKDARFGWSNAAALNGTFTNGAYRGVVHLDARGVRQNAASSTFDPGARSVLIIGDSNAAGFEVDDDQTVAAVVERRLRAGGARVNAVNLGVRGYGTDQAVLRALSFEDLQPRVVLYLYTNNDPFDTNTLHLPGRAFGKGTFIRRAGEATFSPYDYPVPEYPVQEAGVVILDRQCEPVVHQAIVAADARVERFAWAKKYSWTVRALSYLRRGPPVPPLLLADPVDFILDGGRAFDPDLYTSYHEQGPIRSRCPEYFEAQVADLMARLRRMPTVSRVLVAHFPDNEVFADFAAGRPVPSVTMFNHLRATGAIDGYLNLGQRFVEAGLSYPALACPGDGHLCAEGIAWEADEIVKAFGPALSGR